MPESGATHLNVRTPWPRLDHFLAASLEGISRTRVQSLIKDGRVMVNGISITKARAPLAGGEDIAVEIPAVPDPLHVEPEDIPLDVIHEDDHIVVVHKPAGLVTHPGHGVHRGTLVNGLVGRFNRLSEHGDPARPGIVHRLDKDTSGIMVVAKTDEVHATLSSAFERREVEKTYLALVWGTPPEAGTIRTNLIRDSRNRLAFKATSSRGRSAVTEFVIVNYYQHFSLLEVRPHTGRTHQIRVHLAHIGHPVFGDATYGGVRPAAGLAPAVCQQAPGLARLMQRQALHAFRLGFQHPATSKHVTFEAPLPDDFKAVLEVLNQELRA